MKKNSIATTITVLILVFVFSVLTTNFFLPLFNSNDKAVTYTQTNCLTDKVTDDMSIYDIAKMYRNSNATVEVIGSLTYDGAKYNALGSGVVVASTGYKTTTLNPQVEARKGSYIATNYHVVEFLENPLYDNQSISIRAEDEVMHSCEVLWSNKNLDIAIIYADVSFDYVKMVDRWVECSEEDRLDYEEIFTIGSPLDTQYLNRLTVGNIASNNPLKMFTAQTIYAYLQNGEMKYSLSQDYNYQRPTTVLDNLYEGVIDISLGISGGNSGGGCFDRNGNLLGLTTLGTSVEQTDGNQMNGAVPIYPVMKVIDKIIANHEANANHKIVTPEELGLVVLDKTEAYYVRYIKEYTSFSYYFFINKFYDSNYSDIFDFSDNGVCILSNSSSISSIGNIRAGAVITSCKINNGEQIDIKTRNDLLYNLLTLASGDVLTITYKTEILGIPVTSTATISF